MSSAQLHHRVDAVAEAKREVLTHRILEQRKILRKLAMRLCHSPHGADDLVQDTFARALANLHTVDPRHRIGAWLCRILHNLYIDSLRRKEWAVVCLDCMPEVADVSTEPDDEPLWTRVTMEDHAQAVACLPEALRTTYAMVVLEKRSELEVACAQGIKPVTVRTRIHRAREQLRQQLQLIVEVRKAT